MSLFGFAAAEERLDVMAKDTLRLKDTYGDEMMGVEIRAEIAKRYPDETEKLWQDVLNRVISVDEYESKWALLIDRMARSKLFHQTDKVLSRLARPGSNF